MPLQFINSQRGKRQLVHNGYVYNFLRLSKEKMQWRCVEYTNSIYKCKALAETTSTESSGDILRFDNHESHAPDLSKIEAKVIISEAKEAAKTSDDRPRTIIQNITEMASSSAIAELPDISLLTRTLQRTRAAANTMMMMPAVKEEPQLTETYTNTWKDDHFLSHYDVSSHQPLVKRRRENETKRWSDSEVERLLNYIRQHHNKLEKPTARMYYTLLLQETKINTQWHLVRCKIRYLKLTYKKANTWIKSIGDNHQMTEEAIRKKLLSICPYYDQLSTISCFDNQCEDVPYDLGTENSMETSKLEFEDCRIEKTEWEDDTYWSENTPETSNRSDFEAMHQNVEPEDIPNTTLNNHHDYFQLKREELIWTRELETKKLEMQSRKLLLEENKLEFEKEKSFREWELRKMELEQKERLFRYELDLKYGKT